MRMVGDFKIFFEIFNIYFFLFWGGQNNQKGRWGKVLSSLGGVKGSSSRAEVREKVREKEKVREE
jgi:hypothetical protein